MAQTILEQLKLIEEMNKETKILQSNIKELEKALAKETSPGIVKKLESELQEMNVLLEETANNITETSNVLSSDLGSAFDVLTGEARPLTSIIGEMEDALHMMALEGKANTEQFKTLARETGEAKRAIIEADLAVDAIADNRGIANLGEQFGSLGKSVLSLDFNSASNQANNLASNLNKMDFKMVTGGIKQMTSAFASLGKAILANPLFLLASIIVGLVVGIYKLLDSLGLITVILSAVKKAFEPVVAIIKLFKDGLKSLTDWMGLTSHAAEEKATKIADASKQEADAIKKANEETLYIYDQQLEEMKRVDDGSMESLRAQQDIRKQKQQAILEEANANKKASEDELNRLSASLANKYRLSAEEIKNGKLSKDKLALLEEDERKAIEESIEAYRQKTIEAGKEMGNLNLLFGDFVKEAEERANKIAEEDERQRQERIAKAKEYAKNRQDALRAQQDLELELMEEGIEKARKKIALDRARALEDLKADTTKTLAEKATMEKLLTTKYNTQLENLNKAHLDAINEATEKANQEAEEKAKKLREDSDKAVQKWLEERRKLGKTEKELAVMEETDKYKEIKKAIENSIQDKVLLNIRLQELEKDHQTKMKEIEKEFAGPDATTVKFEQTISMIEQLEVALTGLGDTYGQMSASIVGHVMTTATAMKDSFAKINELNAMQAVTDAEQQEINKGKMMAYAQAASATLDMLSGTINAINEANQQAAMARIDNLNAETTEKMNRLQEQLNNGLITQEEFTKQSNKIQEEARKKEEAIRKKAFEDDKKARISSSIISTISGALQAYMGAQSIPIVGPALGAVLAALVGAMGAANIAKISKEKYKGGGNASVSTGPSSVPSTSTASANLLPDIVFRGQGNNLNEQTIGNENVSDNMNINVNISETEITDTQNQVGKYKNFVTL